ncbi:MAG: SRPBCC domain-containing protein [Gemmatimonadota bacterium]|jgi:uncharacterized protein YndB with AHSA1/START domain
MTEQQTRSVETELEIDAPIEAVWKALTDGDEMTRWFPLEARVEPGEGGSIYMSWKNEYDATSPITAWEENRHLATAWQMEHIPNPLVVDYHLETKGGKTVLRLVHSGFPTDETWEDFYQSVRHGWAFELRSLRQYLERHAGKPRSVIYLRRRMKVTLPEVWDGLVGPGGIALEPDAKELSEGVSYQATAPTGDSYSGRVLICEPGLIFAGTVDEIGDGLLRFYMDPCQANPDLSDLMFWISLWDRPASEVDALRAAWSDRLETLFPDGEFR